MTSMSRPLRNLIRRFIGLGIIICVSGCGEDGSDEEGARPQTASSACSIERLADGGFAPSISADGTRIAFASVANQRGLVGNRTTSLFLLNTRTGARTAITTITQTTPRPFRIQLVLSADGNRVAFLSAGTATGENTNGSLEIFLFDAPTNTLTQITKSTAGFSFSPSINRDGTRVAFASSADLTGSNADGNNEIFLFDALSDTITQITNTQSIGADRIFFGNEGPSIDASGTRIAFVSDIDLTGANPDGNTELFLFDIITNTLTQITHLQSTETLAANIFAPSLSDDGNRIVFEATATLPGQNLDGSFELFLFDALTGTFSQITDLTDGVFSDSFAIDNNGTRISFALDTSPGFHSEVFLFDVDDGILKQVTHSGNGTSGEPSMSANGRRIAFSFVPEVILVGADLLGYNSVTPATTSGRSSGGIFLATCAGR